MIKKFFEFNKVDMDGADMYYDFLPRRGMLYLIKGDIIESKYFNEAFRIILDYLENEKISPNITIKIISDYVDSKTSNLVKSLQSGRFSSDKLTEPQKLIFDGIITLPIDYFYFTSEKKISVKKFISNFININDLIPDNVIYLDKMIFFYSGFKLNLKTKKWTPSKNTIAQNIETKKEIKSIFETYNFQKKLILLDYNLIFKIPEKILDKQILEEYDYLLSAKNYNL